MIVVGVERKILVFTLPGSLEHASIIKSNVLDIYI